MGLQLAPAFTICAFATRDLKGFAPQQVWAAGATVGLILVFFAVIGGRGRALPGRVFRRRPGRAHGGANPCQLSMAAAMPGWLVSYIQSVGAHAPWFMGLLAVAAVAATQATAALYSSATGTMFARDFYRHFLNPAASDRQQKLFGRIGIGLTLLAALLLATFAPGAQVQIGALALAAGFQLLPAMAGICWLPWITRRAAVSGLIAGLVVGRLYRHARARPWPSSSAFDLPWGRWPWTIHAAGWGIACNVAVCLVVSLLTQDRRRRANNA